MSTDDKTFGSGKKPLDPRAIRLRRRLGSLPEVIKVHGPPPEDSQQQGGTRERSGSSPPELAGKDDPRARERRKDAKEKLTKRSNGYEMAVSTYEMLWGTDKDPKHKNDLNQWKGQVTTADKLTDDNAAADEYERLIGVANKAEDEVLVLIKRQSAIGDLDKLTKDNKPPDYEGKSKPKSALKEFEKEVTRPVATFLDSIKDDVKARRTISEDANAELVRLQEHLTKKEAEYKEKAAEIDKDKHANTHKLIDGFRINCGELQKQLGGLAKNNVPDELAAYRDKKREVVAALGQLGKTIELWKRLDTDSYDQHLKMLEQKRGVVESIDDKHVLGTNTPDSIKALGDALADIQRANKQVFASKESNNLLNGAVDRIGKEAKSNEDKEFVRQAMMARFDLDKFDGDLTGTALISLYKVFNMVPDSHTKTNKWLTDLSRDMSLDDPESFYQAPDKENAKKPVGVIAIKAMRSSGLLAMAQNNLMGPLLLKGVEGGKKVDQFTWVTLHEIGHAVDHSDDYMKNNQSKVGDWQEHTPSQVTAIMVKELGKEFPKYPLPFLREYLKMARAGSDPAKESALLELWQKQAQVGQSGVTAKELLDDPGVQFAEDERKKFDKDGWDKYSDVVLNDIRLKLALTGEKRKVALSVAERVLVDRVPAADLVDETLSRAKEHTDPNQVPDWKALKASPVMSWFKSAAFKEPKGIFAGIAGMLGSANYIRSANHPIGGRIYHEAYEGDWVSYEPSIRTGRVSDYSLRAPGEYFAEAYAAFMLEKLPGGHPLHDDLQTLKEKEVLAN